MDEIDRNAIVMKMAVIAGSTVLLICNYNVFVAAGIIFLLSFMYTLQHFIKKGLRFGTGILAIFMFFGILAFGLFIFVFGSFIWWCFSTFLWLFFPNTYKRVKGKEKMTNHNDNFIERMEDRKREIKKKFEKPFFARLLNNIL
jgi:hypothetical protein